MGSQRGARAGAATRDAGWCGMMDEGACWGAMPLARMPSEGALPQPVACTPWSRVTAGWHILAREEVETPGSWELNQNCWLTPDTLLCLMHRIGCLGDWTRGCWMFTE